MEINNLIECVEKIDKNSKIGIFTHSVPDPDALGSSWCLKYILKTKFDLESTIICDGELSHPQNLTMQNLLNIPFISIKDCNIEDYEIKLIVDTTTKNTQIDESLITIDHHGTPEKHSSISFLYDVGACCTILTEILKDLDMDIDIPELATCMFLGIRTDTNELVSDSTTDKDWDAYQWLSSKIDRTKLMKIINYPLPTYYLELEKVIAEDSNHFIQNSYYVGGCGVITNKKKDCLAMLADKMNRIEGIETTIVFAIVGDSLKSSIRTSNSSLDADKFAKTLFGNKYAGGKLGSAGSSVPLEGLNLKDENLKGEIWNCIRNSQFSKIKEQISGG
jgi:nanoRNase/pAp phosphatase (c-di-AMP/oligoRNAs hydrolase)